MPTRQQVRFCRIALAAQISMGGLFVTCAPTLAQVSGNIQTQANILSPPVTAILPAQPLLLEIPETTRKLLEAIDYPADRCPPPAGRLKEILKNYIDKKFQNEIDLIGRDRTTANHVFGTLKSLSAELKLKFRTELLVTVPVNLRDCHGQPTTLKASLQFNPTYETNALKTGTNASRDGSADIGGGILISTGVGPDHPYDLFFVNAQSASSRYVTYSSKSLDTLTAQAGYQYFIDGYFYDPTQTPIDKNRIPPTSAATYDVVAFSLVNQTLANPTFRSLSADLLTPQATLARQNFDLGAPTDVCVARTSPAAKPPNPAGAQNPTGPAKNFCYYMDLALTLGQTFADVTSLQNANLAASITVGKRFDNSDWTLAGQAILTPRYFEYVTGGRRDIMVQGGPLLTYAPASMKIFANSNTTQSVSFSLPVNYFQNYSTVAKYSWGGLVIQPTLTVAFAP